MRLQYTDSYTRRAFRTSVEEKPMNNKELRTFPARAFGSTACLAALGALLGTMTAPAVPAQVKATAPYTISTFVTSPINTSQPDSIVAWRDSIIVGFQNHVAKDGSDGLSSTLVEFSLAGEVKRTFSVPGHNDGLRIVGDGKLWALQNEDANPNLVVIDLETGGQTPYKFAPTPHGGGYDDIVVVQNGEVYLTASNPNLNASGVNVFPALVRAQLAGGNVLLEPILYGNAQATDIPTGTSVTLNLTDPDSMTRDPTGNIVFTSQADSLLVWVAHPGTEEQTVGNLGISSSASAPGGAPITIDDTAFAPHGAAYLLVSDVGGGAIYRIDRAPFGFEPGQAYSASDTAGIVGTLNLDTGVVTPIVTGMTSARGLQFVTAAHHSSD
jgi:hypothetical protein